MASLLQFFGFSTNVIKKFSSNTFASLLIRNYRLYFIGQGISLPGTWMQSISQAWLVLKLTGSGTTLGIVTAFQTLPILLLTPFGGVIADRFPKRKILFFTQSTAAVLALVYAILVSTNVIQLWMIYILAACFGTINSIDNPTRQTFVFELVGRDNLSNAISLNSTEINLARIIGPAIAGILISSVGLAVCFFLNSVSYLGVITCLALMHSTELQKAQPVMKFKGQLREGLRYINSTPLLKYILIMMAIVGTLTYEFEVSLPLLARFTFNGDAHYYAFLTSAMGGGAVLGGLATASRKQTSAKGIVLTLFVFSGCIIFTALSPNILFATLGMLFVGITSIRFMTLGNSTLQLESAPEMRSRVMSLWTMAFLGTTPIGGPIIGFIGEHSSPRIALLVSAAAAFCAGVIGLNARRKYRKQRESKSQQQKT